MFIKKIILSSLVSVQNFLLFCAKYTPIINSLLHFQCQSHRKAIVKFIVLFFASTFPIIMTVFVTQVPEESQGSLLTFFINKIVSSFTVSEQFVYSAAFIAPSLYLLFERYSRRQEQHESIPSLLKAINIYPGYWLIFILGFLIIGFTGFAYGGIKLSSQDYSKTVLNLFLTKYSFYIYGFSILALYLSIIQDMSPHSDFFGNVKSQEDKTTDDLDAFVKKGNKNG